AAAFMRAVDPALENGVIVGRLARMADPAGTQDETGNGRINMARALADTGTDFVQPAGAAPVGGGGPFVGPYRAAVTTVTLNAIPSPLTPGQTNVSFSGKVDSLLPPPAESTVELRTLIAGCSNSGIVTAIASTDADGNFSGTFTAPSTFGSFSYKAHFPQVTVVRGTSATQWTPSDSGCRTVAVGLLVTF